MDRTTEIQANIDDWAAGHRKWLAEGIRECGHHEMYFGHGRCVSCAQEASYVSLEEALDQAYPFEPEPEFRPRAMPQTAYYGSAKIESGDRPLARHVEDNPDQYREWIVDATGMAVRYVPGTHSMDARHVRKSARECAPGTVVWLSTLGTIHGPGWKRVTVARWEGHGNGYASLFSTDGHACGQFRAVDLLEVEPA